MNRGIGFQQGWAQDFPKLPARLAEVFPRGLHSGIQHRFLVRVTQPGALIVRKIGEASAAFVLERAKRFVWSIGWLGRKAWRELRDAGQRGNEEEIQFRFHLFV